MTFMAGKVAWHHPRTAAGYRRLTRSRGVWLGCLVSAVLAPLFCISLALSSALPAVSWVVTIPLLPVVVLAFCRRQRIAAVLQAYPWQEVTAHHVIQRPSIIEIHFTEDLVPAYRMIPFPVQVTSDAHPELIWFAGDPRYGGVVSPVGGHCPVRVVPDKVPAEGWQGGDDVLASRVGLRRRSGKGTQT